MQVDKKIWMIKGEEYLMSYIVILNLHILFLGQLGSISQTQNQNMLSPLKFCETRWGSAWYVMERFFQLYDAIKLFLACIREDENGDPKIKLLFEKLPSKEEILSTLFFLRPIILCINYCQRDDGLQSNIPQLRENLIMYYTEFTKSNYNEVVIK